MFKAIGLVGTLSEGGHFVLTRRHRRLKGAPSTITARTRIQRVEPAISSSPRKTQRDVDRVSADLGFVVLAEAPVTACASPALLKVRVDQQQSARSAKPDAERFG
jgi:hypothetical protein